MEAEAVKNYTREIDILIKTVDAYQKEQVKIVAELKRFNKRAGGSEAEFE